MAKVLIVGGGLAGSILALECYNREIDFNWIMSPHIPAASFAAYGMCNPVHYRNKVPTWKAEELYTTSLAFFKKASTLLQTDFFKPMPTHHLVAEPAEFVQWRQNAESTELWKFTTGDACNDVLPYVNNIYCGSIFIKEAFVVNIPQFVTSAHELLRANLVQHDFNFSALIYFNSAWVYQEQTYSHVIFADGVEGKNNPYFSQIPFNPCKGQVLLLKIPGYPYEYAVHKKVVLVPMDGYFICGATYEWNDFTDATTAEARMELEQDLKNIIGDAYAYEIIEQKAGVRPTISDRRPVVGWHPGYKGIGILNGFGTRGLLVGPGCVDNLLNNLQLGIPIWTDWDVNRFKKRLLKNI